MINGKNKVLWWSSVAFTLLANERLYRIVCSLLKPLVYIFFGCREQVINFTVAGATSKSVNTQATGKSSASVSTIFPKQPEFIELESYQNHATNRICLIQSPMDL